MLDVTADLLSHSAVELSELVRSGEVSSRELVGAALDRLQAVDPDLNAITHVDGERALSAAERVGRGDPRPFAGVPIVIKDVIATEGWPYSAGSNLLDGYTATHDAVVVRRIRESGFIPVAQSTCPEMGISPVTESRRQGVTRNPWDTSRTPGGSSGGSAAVVAAGAVPIAHGSDAGGSIRVPASCCGLVGLKPSRGRSSRGPSQGEHFLSVDGVLTRTVLDTAAALDVIAGYEPGDVSWAPPPSEPFAVAAGREPQRLRVALTVEPPAEVPVDPRREQAARETAELLESLGHAVEELTPPWRDHEGLRAFRKLWAVDRATFTANAGRLAGREPSEDVLEPLTWDLYERGRRTDALTYTAVLAAVQAMSRAIVAALHPYDALVTPALAQQPPPVGSIDPAAGEPLEVLRRSVAFTPFTSIANVTGLPAISLPAGLDGDGLPVAVQIFGRPAGEGPLLALARQLEVARPWADRRPPRSS